MATGSNGDGAAHDDIDVVDGTAAEAHSRRSALRFAAAAAAGTAGAVILGQGKAEANDGDNLVIGQANFGTVASGADTQLTTDGRFVVKDWDAPVELPSGVESDAMIFGHAATNLKGVAGFSPNDAGAYGATETGYGVRGESVGTGIGVGGHSAEGIALYAFGTGRLRQSSNFTHTGAPPAHSPLSWELVRDSDGAVWASGNSDTGGSWRRLSSFIGINPVRAWDSREGEPDGNIGGGVKGQMGNGTTRVLEITDLAAIPTDTISVACVLTAVGPTGAGRVVTWPGGGTEPATATGNFRSGNPVTNFYPTIPLGQTGADKGEMVVKTILASGGVDLILDILGYYV